MKHTNAKGKLQTDLTWNSPVWTWLYLFLLLSQAVPHGCHNLWHLPKRGVGVLTFNCCLGVPEEKGIRWNRLLWFVWVFLLPSFLVGGHSRDRHRRGLLRSTSPGCCWGHRRHGDSLGGHVWRRSRWRQRHGGVYQHAPLEKTSKNERRRVRKRGIGDASLQCNPGHPSPTLKSSISSSCSEFAGDGVADRGCSAVPEWCLMFSVASPKTSSDWLMVDRWLLSNSPWPMSPRWTSIAVGDELLKCEPPEFPSSCQWDRDTTRNHWG